jgi:hypothetical protein
MNDMPPTWVLDEDDALELLAFLITAARTQVDEAAEYGPMRLLTAAHRLAESIGSRTSKETSTLLAGPLRRIPVLAVPRTDRKSYVERLDDLCRALTEHLTNRYGTAASSS